MFASPTPSVLTADTLMTYMVLAVRFESVVLFDSKFTSCPSCHNQNWLTHVDPEQNNYDRNLCGTVPKEIQPSQWLYAKPNPKLSTSILTIVTLPVS